MFADAVLCAILKCESLQGSRVVDAPPTSVDPIHFKVVACLLLDFFSVHWFFKNYLLPAMLDRNASGHVW